ncbi:hypothetical protein FBZ89_106145 [Nitrospirillum amazonense]|uniref:Uncharacterized protein n=1 Tax=Nitrospirillum amazonense TaxID=28077 RepID=A0A560FGK6_9PROT|nr:hypothetical protein [Nitrospirillum amazonense]TWB20742.1 hypothetical protein FBZ89_106145 [Nitrospirillum amazonense]
MLIQILMGFSALLLLAAILLWLWRQTVELRLRKSLGSSTDKMRAVSNEKTQVLSFLEQQRMALGSKRSDAAKMRMAISQLRIDNNDMRARDFYVLHQIGEPSKDKEEYACTLMPSATVEPGRELPAALRGIDHRGSIWAESEAAARRQIEMHFPEKGPLRPTGFRRGA